MPESDDIALLKRYAEGDEPAFASLVERYIHLVYSTALRRAGNPSHAEEITQAVFVILARKAKSLGSKTILSGWLYQTARLTASNFLRSEIRRQQREQEAYMQSTLTGSDTVSWEHIAPLLEEAMGRLREADRNAIVLRFFENKTPEEVAATLGLNEVTARKRVSRALEKLRKFFTKRGVILPAAALTTAISENSVHAAPVTLAKAVTATALAKGATASASTLTLIKGALKLMAWTKIKTTIVVGTCVLLAAGTTTITLYIMGKSMRSVRTEWSALSGDDGQWNRTNSVIKGQSTNGDSIFASTREYRDVTLSVIASTANREASLAIRMQDADNGYIIIYSPDGTPCPWDNGVGHVTLIKRISGDDVTLASYHAKRFPSAGQAAKITVIAKGPWINVRLNGLPALRVKDATYASGFIGLRIYGTSDYPCDATFSNLKFY